jgi:hypothetical protein
MEIPRGQLLRRRVLDDPGTVLANVLDRELTGYARLAPQETLLLDAEHIGIVVFEDGVPVAAYQTGTDTGGADAVDELATGGPYRLELYRLDDDILDRITDSDALLVPPALPAERLAENQNLVERTRARAPDERVVPDGEAEPDPIAEFLEDEQQIEAIRERARDEAVARAAEWDLPVEDREDQT